VEWQGVGRRALGRDVDRDVDRDAVATSSRLGADAGM